MRKILFCVLYFSLSTVIYSAISYLGSISFDYKFIIGSLFYFWFMYFILKSNLTKNKTLAFWLIVTPPLLIFVYINILDFRFAIKSFPSSFYILLSSILGYLYFKFHKHYIPIFWLIIGILWLFYGQDFFINKITYGSYTKKVAFRNPINDLYFSPNKKALINSENKTIILDFWNSSCIPCYKLFPYIDEINSKIDTSKILIYVVNIPLKGQSVNSNYRLLNKFDYAFNQLFADNDKILDSVGVRYFPTTIIIKNDTIVYRGDFESAIGETIKK